MAILSKMRNEQVLAHLGRVLGVEDAEGVILDCDHQAMCILYPDGRSEVVANRLEVIFPLLGALGLPDSISSLRIVFRAEWLEFSVRRYVFSEECDALKLALEKIERA